jgi:predicted DCC family thiol-disulfide oxidoreductase YuxK
VPVEADLGVSSYTATLLYDSDCGFCRWGIGQILRQDVKRRVRPLAIQSGEGWEMLATVPVQRRLNSWHLVLADGQLHSGGAVFSPLLDVLDHPVLARLLARAGRLTSSFYRGVANRRTTFGALVSNAAQQRADELIQERGSDPRVPLAIPSRYHRWRPR